MVVKKIYSEYQSNELRDLPRLCIELDILNSYTEDHFIAQRDAFNQKLRDEYDRIQKEEWGKWETRNHEMKENFRKYSEEFREIMATCIFKPREAESRLFDQYLACRIFEIIGKDAYFAAKNFGQKLAVLDPKNIKLPDDPPPTPKPEPTLLTDSKMFKEPVQQKIRELERQIEKIKIETANAMSASQDKPLQLYDGRWLYQNSVYEVTRGHSFDEICLLIWEFADKERRKFERLKNKFSGEKSEEWKYERVRIPEEVRIAVWRRDQGRCARCGSRENLEYDHIVPVSKGGGNTERNIELLCQDCNRAKGNRIE